MQFSNGSLSNGSLQNFSNAVQHFQWSDGVPNPRNAQPDECGRVPGEEVTGGVTSGIYLVAPEALTTFGFNMTMQLPQDGRQYDLFL